LPYLPLRSPALADAWSGTVNTVTVHRPVDHHRLVRRRRSEVERFRRIFETLDGANQLNILHEGDGSCCRRERWQLTFSALYPVDAKRPLVVRI